MNNGQIYLVIIEPEFLYKEHHYLTDIVVRDVFQEDRLKSCHVI